MKAKKNIKDDTSKYELPRVFGRLMSREITIDETKQISGATKDGGCEYTNEIRADIKCPYGK